MLPRLSAAALALLAASPALAQEAPPEDAASILIGGGVATVPEYEGAGSNRVVPVPAAIGSIGGFSFTVIGNRASVDLIPNQPGPVWDFQAGPIGVINFNRTSIKNIDDPRVRALGELDTAIELGGYVGIGKTGVLTSDYDKLSVSVSYRHDVSNVHKSGVWTPSINYVTPLSRKALVGLFASADRVEGRYARTYFGVTPAGALASGLPTYTPRGGWKDVTVGGMAGVSLTGDLVEGGLMLVGGGIYRRLMNDFADTPIVSIAGKRDQWTGAVGLAYRF